MTESKNSYIKSLFRWRGGRQNTGYEKMLLLANPFVLPFDCYLLRYKQGSEIPVHTDPVDSKRHFRLNIVLKEAVRGGEFVCSNPIRETRRIKYFRPDQSAHSVTRVEEGTRYVLSIGWVR